MKEIEALIREHPVFQGLGAEYIKLIAGCGKNVRFDGGALIFREGEPADLFYMIRHGHVALQTSFPGQAPRTLQTLAGGEVLGWSWLFPPYRCHCDAKALDVVRAVALDGACLRGKCDEDHQLGYEMMKRFSHIMLERLQATHLQLLDVYGRPE